MLWNKRKSSKSRENYPTTSESKNWKSNDMSREILFNEMLVIVNSEEVSKRGEMFKK